MMKGHVQTRYILVMLAAALGLLLAGRVNAQFASAYAVTHVAAGADHTLFTKSDGSLWVMGDNRFGQLGIGPTIMWTNVPQEILTNGVGAIAAGQYHSLFIMNRALWGMGTNGYGQLGDGTTTTRYFPEQVYGSGRSFFSFTAIGAGWYHSLFGTASSSTGTLLAMGYNLAGQLGDGTTNEEVTPETILTVHPGSAVTAVAGGWFHSLFIRPGGSLWAMGNNSQFELGDGTLTEHKTPEQIVSSNVVAIAAGYDFSLFVKSDGSLWAMGDNYFGELGVGTDMDARGTPTLVSSNVVAIAAGYDFSLFIKSDGSLWGMGDDYAGQLGDGLGPGAESDVPEEIVSSNVVAVTAGLDFGLFIKSDGSLWGMGDNFYGQLGNTSLDPSFPVEIVAPPPPQLAITLSEANAILTWPTNAIGFTLQSATNLLPQALWSAVSPGSVIINGENTVTNPISGAKMFYRLTH